MKTRSIAAALLVAFAPLALGAPAFAQPADDPTITAARARFQEGVAFYDQGQFEKARASFLQAYALRKHPAVLLNLAQSSLRSGHALEAAKYFQQYLKESQGLSPAQRADAERGLNEARQKLGRIEIAAPAGSVLTVDGEGVGTAPLTDPVDVEPGSHKVKAGNEELKVDVAAGQRANARFGGGNVPSPVILPAPLPAPATVPGPPPPADTPNPGGAAGTVAGNANVDTGETKPVVKKNLLAPPANPVPVYIGAGLTLVGVGVAIGIGVIAKGSAQSAADSVAADIRKNGGTSGTRATPGTCADTNPTVVAKFGKACAALADDNSKVDTDAAIGNVALGVAIASAAFAVGWYLLAPKKQDAKAASTTETWKTATISPIIGTRVGGLSLGGSF